MDANNFWVIPKEAMNLAFKSIGLRNEWSALAVFGTTTCNANSVKSFNNLPGQSWPFASIRVHSRFLCLGSA
jgi:hypothetical protein